MAGDILAPRGTRQEQHDRLRSRAGDRCMPEQRWIRSSLVWIVLIVAILAMWATFVGNDSAPTPRSIGQVAQEVRDDKVQKLVQAEGSREVLVKYAQEAGRRDAVTTIPEETDLLSVLENYGIKPRSPAGVDRVRAGQPLGRLAGDADLHPADALPGRHLRLHDAAGAGHEQPGDVVRQEPRPPLHRRTGRR